MAEDARIVVTVDANGAVTGMRAAGNAVEDFGRRVEKTQGVIKRFERSVGSFRKAVLSVGNILTGFGLAMLVRELVQVNTEFERVRLALLAGSESALAAGHDFAFIRSEAIKLGMPLSKVGLEFAKLAASARGTALQGQPVRDLFRSVTQAAVATGRDAATTQRIFMALSQMLSKGRVQAEEARQQFGEHLPRGFILLGEAAGFSADQMGAFSEALKKGDVDAINMLKALPAVLDKAYGAVFEAALISSPEQAFGSFKAMVEDVAYTIGQGGFMREFVGLVRDMTKYLRSDEGTLQLERTAKVLGMLMGMVRQIGQLIMENMSSVMAAFAGIMASGFLLFLKSIFGWFVRIAGGGSLIAAAMNPWVLLAGAIGLAVSALVAFGDDMFFFSNDVTAASARGIDWVRASLEALGEEFKKAATAFLDFIGVLPLINGAAAVVNAAVGGFRFVRPELSSTTGEAERAAAQTISNTIGEGAATPTDPAAAQLEAERKAAAIARGRHHELEGLLNANTATHAEVREYARLTEELKKTDAMARALTGKSREEWAAAERAQRELAAQTTPAVDPTATSNAITDAIEKAPRGPIQDALQAAYNEAIAELHTQLGPEKFEQMLEGIHVAMEALRAVGREILLLVDTIGNAFQSVWGGISEGARFFNDEVTRAFDRSPKADAAPKRAGWGSGMALTDAGLRAGFHDYTGTAADLHDRMARAGLGNTNVPFNPKHALGTNRFGHENSPDALSRRINETFRPRTGAEELGAKIQDTFGSPQLIEQEVEPKIDPAKFRQKVVEATQTAFAAARDGLRWFEAWLADVARIAGSVFAELGRAIGETFGTLGNSLMYSFNAVLDAIKPMIDGLREGFANFSTSDLWTGLVQGAQTAIGIVINIFLGLINAIGPTIRFIGEMLAIAFEAVQPLIEPILRGILDLLELVGRAIKPLFEPDSSLETWHGMTSVVKGVVDVIAWAIEVSVTLISTINGVVGPIIDAIIMVVKGLYNTFAPLMGLILDVVVKTFNLIVDVILFALGLSAQHTNSALKDEMAPAWVQVGDVIIGILVTVIEWIGFVIQALGSAVGAIVEMGQRAFTVFSSLGTMAGNFLNGDMDAAAAAGQRMSDAFTTPLNAGFADVGKSFDRLTGKMDDNFGILSRAHGQGQRAGDSVRRFGRDAGGGFDSFNTRRAFQMDTNRDQRIAGALPGALDEHRRSVEARAAGEGVGGSYVDGIIQGITERAAELSFAHSSLQLDRAAARKAADDARAQAYAAEQAGVNRDHRPEKDEDEDAKKRKKSAAEKAAKKAFDRIDELRAQMSQEQMLIDGLNRETIAWQRVGEVQYAQTELRKAGYNVTVQSVLAEKSLAGELARTAIAAYKVHDALENLEEMQKTIAENEQEDWARGHQLEAIMNESLSNQQVEAELAANNALREKGIFLTYRQVMATTDLANATARRFAESSYNRSMDDAQVQVAQNIRKTREALAEQRRELGMYSNAASLSAPVVEALDAEIAGQNAVLAATNKTTWEASMATDALTRSIYENAKAMALAGGSTRAYGDKLEELRSRAAETGGRRGRIGEERRQIMNDDAATRQQLDAGYNLSLDANNADQSMSLEAKIAANNALLANYRQGLADLDTVTNDALMRNSDSVTDAMRVAFEDHLDAANDWATNTTRIFDMAMDGMTDMIVQFAMTGKLEWREFARSVIAEIMKMIAKMLLMKAIEMGLNMIMPGSGTAFTAGAKAFGFADGGVMTSDGPVPLRAYARGGVANTPQLALFGEGRMAEAYVPLPDGRTIPVTMKMPPIQVASSPQPAPQIFIGAPTMPAPERSTDRLILAAEHMLERSTSALLTPPEPRTSRIGPMQYYNTRDREGPAAGGSRSVEINSYVTVEAGGVGGLSGGDTAEHEKMAAMISKRVRQDLKGMVVETVASESRPGGSFNRMGSSKERF